MCIHGIWSPPQKKKIYINQTNKKANKQTNRNTHMENHLRGTKMIGRLERKQVFLLIINFNLKVFHEKF